MDDRIRAFFYDRRPDRVFRSVMAVLCAIVQFLLCMRMQFAEAGTMADRLTVSFFLLIPLLLMLFSLYRHVETIWEIVLGSSICLSAMVLRIVFLDRVSSDFEVYLSGWMKTLAEQSFGASMKMTVGEYHVLYQYLMFILTRLPLPALYGVKILSFVGDAFLLGAGFELMKSAGTRDLRALLMLLLPAIAMNGAMFAQCDALYTAAAMWGLAFLLSDRPAQGMACFALSLCFKLQVIFVLPILPVLYMRGRFGLRDFAVFLGTILIVQIPALLGGKSVSGLLAVYTDQMGMYTGLNYGAPNIWAFMATEGLDVYAYGWFGIAMALGICLLLIALGMRIRSTIKTQEALRQSALIALCCFFFLPRMHERYIYPAEVLTMLTAMCDVRALPAVAVVSLAAFAALFETALPLWGSAILVLFAILFLLSEMRIENRGMQCEQNK